MITDTIELSSDENSESDFNSSLPVKNHVNQYSEDSDTVSLTGKTTRYNTSPFEDPPITDKKKRIKNKGNDNKKKVSAAEKKELKRRQAEEKRAAKNANKIYKPGECMKYMCIEMHPDMLESWFCADVQREANASGVKIKSSSIMCDTSLVLWTRNVMPTLTTSDGFVQLTPSKVKCDHGLYIFTVENVEQLVVSHSLSKHIKLAAKLAGCKLTLVLFGVKDYFKTSGRKTSKSQRLMTEVDLEKAVTDLLVSADCDTVVVNTPNELALTIVQFTKAIAEEPHKRAKRALDEQADFYMRGENKKCVPIDKDGHGLSKLWQQMIAILPLSSLETSRAICSRYKTPLELYEALQSSDGVSELASIGVSRAAVPGAKARRVGPEFARKLHALFTEDDGSFLLD